MRINEILCEFNFYGRKCTKDCSGHKAGWYWAKKKAVPNSASCASKSPSLTGGCETTVNQTKLQHPRVRNEKGKFVNPQKKG